MNLYRIMNVSNGDIVKVFEDREEAEAWIEDQDEPVYEIMEEK